MGDDVASVWLREDVVKRAEVLTRLRAAVYFNAQSCANNLYPAAYAFDHAIGAELNEPFYEAASVDVCVISLLAAPCATAQVTDVSTITSGYVAIMRLCGPKPRGL